jgi:hypothetical protein
VSAAAGSSWQNYTGRSQRQQGKVSEALAAASGKRVWGEAAEKNCRKPAPNGQY